MAVFLIARLINILADLIILLIIVEVSLSYFLSPYHPIRHALERIVEPMLAPLRRVIPLVGMIDFSPLVLIILVQIVSYALINLLNAFVR
jgi:YggT family protein